MGLRRFVFQKLAFLDFLDMPICEKVHISSYLDISQMTAAAAAAASQELSHLVRPQEYHVQEPNIPFRGIPHFDEAPMLMYRQPAQRL